MNFRQKQYLVVIILFIPILLFVTFGLFEAFEFKFSFSYNGFRLFASFFEQYNSIFVLSLTILAVYISFLQLYFSNYNSKKNIAIQYIKEFLDNKIAHINTYMHRKIILSINDIYDYLAEINFKFSNKDELEDFFDVYFKGKIRFFEELNQNFINMDNYYSSDNHAYSLSIVQDFFSTILEPSKCYTEFNKDLKEIYLEYKNSEVELGTVDEKKYNEKLIENIKNNIKWFV